jgi:hypothetical protein
VSNAAPGLFLVAKQSVILIDVFFYQGTSNFPPISDMAPKWRLSEQNDLWDWNVMKHYRKVYKVVKQKKLAGFATNIIE